MHINLKVRVVNNAAAGSHGEHPEETFRIDSYAGHSGSGYHVTKTILVGAGERAESHCDIAIALPSAWAGDTEKGQVDPGLDLLPDTFRPHLLCFTVYGTANAMIDKFHWQVGGQVHAMKGLKEARENPDDDTGLVIHANKYSQLRSWALGMGAIELEQVVLLAVAEPEREISIEIVDRAANWNGEHPHQLKATLYVQARDLDFSGDPAWDAFVNRLLASAQRFESVHEYASLRKKRLKQLLAGIEKTGSDMEVKYFDAVQSAFRPANSFLARFHSPRAAVTPVVDKLPSPAYLLLMPERPDQCEDVLLSLLRWAMRTTGGPFAGKTQQEMDLLFSSTVARQLSDKTRATPHNWMPVDFLMCLRIVAAACTLLTRNVEYSGDHLNTARWDDVRGGRGGMAELLIERFELAMEVLADDCEGVARLCYMVARIFACGGLQWKSPVMIAASHLARLYIPVMMVGAAANPSASSRLYAASPASILQDQICHIYCVMVKRTTFLEAYRQATPGMTRADAEKQVLGHAVLDATDKQGPSDPMHKYWAWEFTDEKQPTRQGLPTVLALEGTAGMFPLPGIATDYFWKGDARKVAEQVAQENMKRGSVEAAPEFGEFRELMSIEVEGAHYHTLDPNELVPEVLSKFYLSPTEMMASFPMNRWEAQRVVHLAVVHSNDPSLYGPSWNDFIRDETKWTLRHYVRYTDRETDHMQYVLQWAHPAFLPPDVEDEEGGGGGGEGSGTPKYERVSLVPAAAHAHQWVSFDVINQVRGLDGGTTELFMSVAYLHFLYDTVPSLVDTYRVGGVTEEQMEARRLDIADWRAVQRESCWSIMRTVTGLYYSPKNTVWQQTLIECARASLLQQLEDVVQEMTRVDTSRQWFTVLLRTTNVVRSSDMNRCSDETLYMRHYVLPAIMSALFGVSRAQEAMKLCNLSFQENNKVAEFTISLPRSAHARIITYCSTERAMRSSFRRFERKKSDVISHEYRIVSQFVACTMNNKARAPAADTLTADEWYVLLVAFVTQCMAGTMTHRYPTITTTIMSVLGDACGEMHVRRPAHDGGFRDRRVMFVYLPLPSRVVRGYARTQKAVSILCDATNHAVHLLEPEYDGQRVAVVNMDSDGVRSFIREVVPLIEKDSRYVAAASKLFGDVTDIGHVKLDTNLCAMALVEFALRDAERDAYEAAEASVALSRAKAVRSVPKHLSYVEETVVPFVERLKATYTVPDLIRKGWVHRCFPYKDGVGCVSTVYVINAHFCSDAILQNLEHTLASGAYQYFDYDLFWITAEMPMLTVYLFARD